MDSKWDERVEMVKLLPFGVVVLAAMLIIEPRRTIATIKLALNGDIEAAVDEIEVYNPDPEVDQ